MKFFLMILLQSYLALFSGESDNALRFIRQNEKTMKQCMNRLSDQERLMAMAIVAPEVSQFSNLSDFMELRTLFISYRNFGTGDFSVGQFQMKPSFVEALEKEINSNAVLKEAYSSYLPEGDDIKAVRECRLNRLASLEWQYRYLQLFIDVVKLKTKNIKFPSQNAKLRHWATLYNSGFNSTPKRVEAMQKKKLFPRNSKKFNYADIAVEFYNKLNQEGF